MLKKYLKKDYTTETHGNITMFKVPVEEIKAVCLELFLDSSLELKTITAQDLSQNKFKIIYIFGVPGGNIFIVPYIIVSEEEGFPSIANEIHTASGYERKIHTFFGLEPTGHPHSRPILLHENWPFNQFPLRKDFKWSKRPEPANNIYEFEEIQGEGIYEIPVGPVHAGIIEPGHFRFSVSGEEIINLESKLGYTHKGSEKLFETLSMLDKIKLSERISGDSSFSHSLAFCQAVEILAEIKVPENALWLRVIFSELERLANHFGDIGFILQDTGYSFGGRQGQRLREIMMRWNERLTGSRFLRDVNTIGSVKKSISPLQISELRDDLQKIWTDFSEIMEIVRNESTVTNRLEKTGKLDQDIALDHGVVGLVARSTGIDRDARRDYPYAAYDKIKFEVAGFNGGDVKARFDVRVKEVETSINILMKALSQLSQSSETGAPTEIKLKNNSYAVGLTEGWRGEILYFVATDSKGAIDRVEVRDPSFINWTVVGHAGKGNVVPDFPLINKSFNLSYSGNDL